MSLLLDAEKLQRTIEKLEKKRDKRIEKARADCHAAILAARQAASTDVLCLLDSARNLGDGKVAAE